MKVFVKFDINALCTKVLEDQLNSMNVTFNTTGFGEFEIIGALNSDKLNAITKKLEENHIQIVENQKNILVQKIKDAIIDMIFNEDLNVNVKTSVYLAEKLGNNYNYLSNLFSEITHTSIENFIIFQKIEYAKKLIIQNNLSLTEIAFKLNYSSVAHLSTQFKSTTGITPSAFMRIVQKRNN